MELAGLKIVMDADFDAVYSAVTQANAMMQEFGNNVKNVFNGIPDLKSKFNFTSNGASQAAQDAREYARAARDQAAADLDSARANDIADKAAQRLEKSKKKELDTYGQLVAQNQALVRTYYNAAAAIIKQGDAAGISADQLEEMRQAALRGQQELQKIEQGAGRFQRNVGNYASGFNPLNNSIMQLTREFPAFANSVQTGLMGISNNIGPIYDAIKQLVAINRDLISQGKPTESVFKAIAGALFSWQTALSVGITLLTVYGKDIIEWGTSLFSATSAINKAKSAIDSLNSAFDGTDVNKATQDVKELTVNIDLARKGFISKEKVLKQYNSTIGQVTGEVSNLDQAESALAKNADAYVRMTLYKSAANEALKKSAELAVQAEQDLANSQNSLLDPKNAQAITGGGSPVKMFDFISGLFKARGVAAKKENAKTLEDIAQDFQTRAAKIAQENKFDFFGNQIESKASSKQVTKDAVDALAVLVKENKKADDEFQSLAISFGDSLVKKAENYRKYIITLMGDFNVPLEDKRITNALSQISSLTINPISEGLGLKDLPADLQKIGLTATVSAQQFDAAMKQYGISIKQAGIDKEVEALTKMLNESIEDTLQKTATLVSEGIGSLMAGKGSIADIFKGILSLLGDQIAAFGKQLIQAGVLMKAANDSIGKLAKQPTLAIAVGAAAIALGTALKASLSKSSNNVGRMPFASGGVVYGPTNALVGEYSGARGNPEVIAPLDKLTTILRNTRGNNGGTEVIILEPIIKGQDILLAVKRAEKTQNR